MSKLLFCPQPTPHVSLSPSLPATMDAASTLTGAVIMVSVCSFFSLLLSSVPVYSGNCSLPFVTVCCACFATSLTLYVCVFSPFFPVFCCSVLLVLLFHVVLFAHSAVFPWFCLSEKDCGDGSDELNCPNLTG